MENKIYINHKGTIFNPEPIEEIQWSTRLFGAGELKFKVLKDNVMDFKEGDQVTFYRNNVPIFKGYVFSKERCQPAGAAVYRTYGYHRHGGGTAFDCTGDLYAGAS